MKVHQMSEPWFSILVTGTDDVGAAREAAESTVAEYFGRDDEMIAAFWDNHPPRQETGRIVPAQPDNPEGVSWWWRSGYKPGKPGVTRAVLFTREWGQ
jgi:hypothetical protein